MGTELGFTLVEPLVTRTGFVTAKMVKFDFLSLDLKDSYKTDILPKTSYETASIAIIALLITIAGRCRVTACPTIGRRPTPWIVAIQSAPVSQAGILAVTPISKSSPIHWDRNVMIA
jgi:hypothetical protein